jgi:hypothetical protein
VTDLEAAGLPVWLDVHKIKPGVVWDSEIELALRSTDVLLVVLSENSAASTNVLDEINFALSKNRLVVPVLHRSCEIPYRLARLQHIDFTGPRDLALHRLIERLRAATAPADPASSASVPDATVHKPVPPDVRTPVPAAAPTKTVSTHAAAIPVWQRPAVVGVVAGVCVLLAAGFWLLRGRNDSEGARSTASPAAALQAPAQIGAVPPAAGQPPANAVTERAASEPPAPPSNKIGARGVSPAPKSSPAQTPNRPGDATGKPAPTTAASPEPLRAAPTESPAPPESNPIQKPSPVPAAPVATNPVAARAPEPAPVRSAPAAVDEEAQVRNVIALYERALNEKNLSGLLQTRPSLPRPEAQAILKGMEGAHTVSFGEIAVKVNDRQASARMTRRDVLPNNPNLQIRVTMTLLKQGEGWVIERIERTQ